MPNILDTIQVSGASYDLKDKNAPSVSSLTQSEYDNLPSTAKTSNTFFVITDAQAGDLTNYYTKTETNTLLGGKADTATTYTKTEVDNAITAATSTKQDTLVSGTNIKTINNESLLGSGNITIQGGGGGGKAIEAGRGISVTTGETADTVSFNLPISAGTGTDSLIVGYSTDDSFWASKALGKYAIASGPKCSATTNNSVAIGYYNTAGGVGGAHGNFAQGYQTMAMGNRCHSEGLTTSATSDASHSEGYSTLASGNYSHSEGEGTKATNVAEHSEGRYNISNKTNTTWGDSGNTLFSVGNGTANNARHNAFEIRQNGDIYYFDGTNDVKLQDKFSSLDSTIGDINTILESI